MKKTLILLGLSLLLLTGCQPQEYKKCNGEVVEKFVSMGRYSDDYYIKVSYFVGHGKYAIDSVSVDREEYDTYKVKDDVMVYVDKDGIWEIVK